MIELIDTTCTRCGQPMRLPQHVADLPADARLCAVCVRLLLRGVEEEAAGIACKHWDSTGIIQYGYLRGLECACRQRVAQTQPPLSVPQAERAGMAEEEKVKFE